MLDANPQAYPRLPVSPVARASNGMRAFLSERTRRRDAATYTLPPPSGAVHRNAYFLMPLLQGPGCDGGAQWRCAPVLDEAAPLPSERYPASTRAAVAWRGTPE